MARLVRLIEHETDEITYINLEKVVQLNAGRHPDTTIVTYECGNEEMTIAVEGSLSYIASLLNQEALVEAYVMEREDG
jgi:hypothetical protein